ncbi:N-acetylmuramoyl-L-alanine amidase [Mannheimia sp. AT1]|uniref:N-acetylmuramoyl-L-alanine amidase n=1 Tax=Mannheimia cairinae TaxID=3025936 RepID=A0ABT5MNB4_9PAST|nr:N-acetylmuramoyl-L-alanine amidase [Mannheimia cairinae]MDD0823669.1 N-acetylmuramoyl-L-alanine amidase [Mannheimia cairinae]MDD0825399.1 N-acetylmuramoyl-L-alanine amidase [Mannheimia cairinae]
MNKVIKYFIFSIFSLLSFSSFAKTVVAIDAGHGGKDPGAIGKRLGIQEKNITLAISKELKALLDADPNFKAVMTRSGDYFIQLPQRTEIARKHKAELLISIHADSSPKSDSLRGASVWVLSNRRASDEMGKWLEDHEKQSELLGGAGSVLSNNNERYLNQTVLDLQFSHSQRSGYELGRNILNRMAKVTTLAKSTPQHASLSVLRSPDITSVLIETGFLSNPTEEAKLATASYRKQVARAIYNGLVAYRAKNAKTTSAPTKNSANEAKKSNTANKTTKKTESSTKVKQTEKNTSKKADTTQSQKREVKVSSTNYHTVQKDETVYSIARAYGTTPQKISELNKLKNYQIRVGQKLKVK